AFDGAVELVLRSRCARRQTGLFAGQIEQHPVSIGAARGVRVVHYDGPALYGLIAVPRQLRREVFTIAGIPLWDRTAVIEIVTCELDGYHRLTSCLFRYEHKRAGRFCNLPFKPEAVRQCRGIVAPAGYFFAGPL